MTTRHDTIIVGGGPAGLFCALLLAKGRAKVILLEKMDQCGRKLLISGSGQCNLTHAGDIPDLLARYGEGGRFIRPALMNFSNRDLIGFFVERGVTFREDTGGKFFPESGKARDIRDLLVREANRHGALIRTCEPVGKADPVTGGFRVCTEKGEYLGESLVIATGGCTYPRTGSSGDGFRLAKTFGHSLTDPGPALTPVYLADFPFGDLSGISFPDIPMSLYRNNKKVRDHHGDILITHHGLSGPGILDLSRYIRSGDVLRVSFIPYTRETEAREEVERRIMAGGPRLVKSILTGFALPERFVRRLMEDLSVPLDSTCAQCSKTSRRLVINAILDYPFRVSRTGDFDEAMVTRGGVSLREVRPESMESRIVKNLYFIGEVLDIDGDCGGFNLQAAFSTAYLAARQILKE